MAAREPFGPALLDWKPMPDLARILAAKAPLTLSSLPRGSVPLVLGDLARAAKQRAVFIAPDDAAMRAAAEAARFFAPEIEVVEFPAWDCLPYDRASPALSISAQRLAALHRLQKPGAARQLLVTTVNAVLQRVLTPFRVRESVREFRAGVQIGHESLAALLTRQGYSRTDTVIDHGEFAVRGSIVDIFPSSLEAGLRLDFFGDELESLRLFDPATQLTVERLDSHLLLPASEALVDDESIKRFRTRYRELFGASATQDPLYEAVSDGRRLAGMEHWLPLFEDKLASLFDHLGADDVVVIDQGALAAADERLNDIADYHTQRQRIASEKAGSYRPLAPDALYLSRGEFEAALAKAPAHRATGFAAESGNGVLDFGFTSARDFAPERGRSENIYEAAAKHFAALAKSGRRALMAAYSQGSAKRIAAILEEAGCPSALAGSWQEALGLSAKGRLALMVLPLETGFANADLELLTEADVLGDRLVRRKKKRKDSYAFLAELQALSRGDLVVHVEHGIGRYLGLEPIPVGKSQHDCVALEYAGGDKLFIPVENLDVLTRYGSSEQAVALDKLGALAHQARQNDATDARCQSLDRPGQFIESGSLCGAAVSQRPQRESEGVLIVGLIGQTRRRQLDVDRSGQATQAADDSRHHAVAPHDIQRLVEFARPLTKPFTEHANGQIGRRRQPGQLEEGGVHQPDSTQHVGHDDRVWRALDQLGQTGSAAVGFFGRIGSTYPQQQQPRVIRAKRRRRDAQRIDSRAYADLAGPVMRSRGNQQIVDRLTRRRVESETCFLPHQLAGREREELRSCAIGLDDAQGCSIDHEHRISGDLEQQPIARLGLAPLPVVALHFLLRLDEALLDRSNRAQVAAHRQHRAMLAQPNGGIRDGKLTAIATDRDFASLRYAGLVGFKQKLLDLAARVVRDGVGPGTTDPVARRGHGVLSSGDGDVADHTVAIDDERDVTCHGRERGGQFRGQMGKRPEVGAGIGGDILWSLGHV